MPNSNTFDVPEIGNFVKRYLQPLEVSVDPFARNKRWATHTNDLNPKTEAEHHMDAEDFLHMLAAQGVRCDLAIFDPPYSPRQISECYKEAGITCGMKETQNAALYARIKNALMPILKPGAIVLSFGWNSAGMGKKHGFEIVEVMLCCHGAAHNDTICLAERRNDSQGDLFHGSNSGVTGPKPSAGSGTVNGLVVRDHTLTLRAVASGAGRGVCSCGWESRGADDGDPSYTSIHIKQDHVKHVEESKRHRWA